ncbi:hypothetical protein D3C80_1280600 [compost metagenome]
MRFGEYRLIQLIETAYDFACKFQMWQLILSDRNDGCFAECNIRCLADGITEKSVIHFIKMAAFRFRLHCRVMPQQIYRNKHGKIDSQFGNFRDQRLDIKGSPLRINSCGQIIECDLTDMAADIVRPFKMGRQRLHIR